MSQRSTLQKVSSNSSSKSSSLESMEVSFNWGVEKREIINKFFNYFKELSDYAEGMLQLLSVAYQKGELDKNDYEVIMSEPERPGVDREFLEVILQEEEYRQNWNEGGNVETEERQRSVNEGSQRARKMETSKGKRRMSRTDEMSDEQFLNVLKCKLSLDTGSVNNFPSVSECTTELQLIDCLKLSFNKLKNNSLLLHADFGFLLKTARDKFKKFKTKWNIKDIWETWVVKQVGISSSYARKHILVAELMGEYKELRKLNMSFSEMVSLRTKIKTVLDRNREAAQVYKGVYVSTAHVNLSSDDVMDRNDEAGQVNKGSICQYCARRDIWRHSENTAELSSCIST